MRVQKENFSVGDFVAGRVGSMRAIIVVDFFNCWSENGHFIKHGIRNPIQGGQVIRQLANDVVALAPDYIAVGRFQEGQ
jgi:hypothetical protein